MRSEFRWCRTGSFKGRSVWYSSRFSKRIFAKGRMGFDRGVVVGMRSRRETVEELRRVIPETEAYIVGDATRPESVGEAVHAAFAAANEI